MINNHLQYLVALSLMPGLGSSRLANLIDYFGSAEQVWRANYRELLHVRGIGKEMGERIANHTKAVDINKIWDRLDKNGVQVVSIYCENYPYSLKQIYNPPVILYYKGSLMCGSNRNLAIVGSRRASPQGRMAAKKMAKELVVNGFTVVSGLARGIDTAAHLGCLEGGGRTIGVLGCGINVVYPKENKKLIEQIEQNGLIVSEYYLDIPPDAGNFPSRNRIISGLSMGVVVVEAASKSGALITVDFALEQGRDVFALPGNIYNPMSQGANDLIKQGAKMVTKTSDIIEEYNFLSGAVCSKPITPAFQGEEGKIFSIIGYEPTFLDYIIEQSQLSPQIVMNALLHLELKHVISQLPGNYFIRQT